MFRQLLERYRVPQRFIAPLRFILSVLLVYGLWKIFFHLVIKPDFFLHPHWEAFNNFLAGKTIYLAALILKKIFCYELIFNKRNIFIEGTAGYYLANHCLGIPPAVVFAGFIVSYPGNVKYKLWYIPFGIFSIFFINVLRVAALGVTQVNFNEYFFDIAHTEVYLVLCYGMFFLLVMWWMNVWSRK